MPGSCLMFILILLWTYSIFENVNVTDTISWQGHHDRVMQLNWLHFRGICQMISQKAWPNTALGCNHQSTCMPQLQSLCYENSEVWILLFIWHNKRKAVETVDGVRVLREPSEPQVPDWSPDPCHPWLVRNECWSACLSLRHRRL